MNMNLRLDYSITYEYNSNSQKARIVTEQWVANNLYCPICGAPEITRFSANKPVADFFCDICASEFELKSKEGNARSGVFSAKVVDGAYNTMIQRITSNNNPHLFFMIHSEKFVKNLIFVPRFFFTPNIIEMRPPLSETARRAGWVGCNILLDAVPQIGKIALIRDSEEVSKEAVVAQYLKARTLQTDDINIRGWLLDVFICIEKLGEIFTLDEIYKFDNELSLKHPKNNNIRPKIRQQLQLLRKKGLIEFLDRGVYKKL